VSSLPPIEGTLATNGFANAIRGSVSGPVTTPSVAGESGESLESSAVSELSGLISSLGSLSAQAQTLPLSVPTLPGAQQPPSYQPQATDYLGFAEDSN
jgi:hypothetical protein